uniref:Uncharacterized protein n=1 Tax=Chenopodium quinoa TaxID=63459 RepID=A0A803L7D8_CHEQI
MKVRTMLPWSIRCNCAAEFVKKRDPQNSDYVIEAGATRLFEQCRIGEDVIVGEKRKLESEETGDVMKGLENRMLKSKREMDLVARFEELKSVQARRGRVGVDTLLEELKRTGDEKTVDDEDEEVSERTHVLTVGNLTEVDSSKFVTSDGKQPVLQSMAPAVRFMVMRKPTQKSDGDSESVKKEDTASGLQSLYNLSKIETSDGIHGKQPNLQPLASVLRYMVMRKPAQNSDGNKEPVKKEDIAPCSGLQSLCQYDSEDE